MKKPSILLVIISDMSIYKAIEENLRFLGFDVQTIVYDAGPFSYPSLWIHLKTKFRQIVLRDKFAKQKLKLKLLYQSVQFKQTIASMQQSGGVDYALFIRADIWNAKFIKNIRQYVNKAMIGYQWDGMHRFLEIWKLLPYFDRFYVFDPNDVNEQDKKCLPATNFYLDDRLEELPVSSDFYFIGLHVPMVSRTNAIIRFAQLAKEKDWNLDFRIMCNIKDIRKISSEYALVDNIKVSSQRIEYRENVYYARQAKVLVDFLNGYHGGLSFRVFEALGYEKKLITTNPNIVKYDFYHPNNILVWDGNTLDGIEEFLQKPYVAIDPEIKQKYAFSNWIRYILDLEPHINITLPS